MKRRSVLLLAAWCVLLALGIAWTHARLDVSADLRLFMPAPRTQEQKLLVQNIGESPASRLLLLAIGADQPAALADLSKKLAAALNAHPEFTFAANGTLTSFAIPEELLPYRYLLSDSFDAHPLDRQKLADELADRVADMASPAAGALEEWLPRDPTLEVLHLAARWQPRFEPRRIDDVWFSADGRRALLLAETRAAAFDPDGQSRALAVLRGEFARARGTSAAELVISGSGYFSSIIKNRTQQEATVFGGAATLGLILLMWFAYRHAGFLLLGALPLASGALAGLVAVSGLFDSVHGITLAFGFTLIGVAQDYPIHLFSHLAPGATAQDTARKVWRPLATGVASTCIAYLAFLVSGVTGLAQLACLTVTGLIVAGLTTRFLLPLIVPVPRRDPAASAFLGRLDARISRVPRPLWLLALIPILGAAAVLWRPEGFWQNDLAKLTPVPADLLRIDGELRREMATPDLRYLFVASGVGENMVLTDLERLERGLAASVKRGELGGYDHAARYLPRLEVQRARRDALPDAAGLRSMLRDTLADLPFTDDLFEPFVADVERAKKLQPLTHAAIADTPLALTVGDLLFPRDGRWYGIVSLYDVRDPAAVAQLAQRGRGVTFLDLKAASEALVATQRSYIIYCLQIAAVLLIAVIWITLRRISRVLRVLAPMVLTTIVIVTVLRACDVSLNLFHLISLVLAAGLGLDYALFFEHAANDPDRRRTLHALMICAASTLLVFALLTLSSVPVLQSIGITVTLGVVANFGLALLLSRERPA
jgi:predicted exporter